MLPTATLPLASVTVMLVSVGPPDVLNVAVTVQLLAGIVPEYVVPGVPPQLGLLAQLAKVDPLLAEAVQE